MTIICLGDSITYGNWDARGGWVGRLRESMDSKSLAAYKGSELYSKYYTLTYNLGIPGDTTAGLLQRIEAEITPRFNPDEETTILIAIGINDSRFYLSENHFEMPFDVFEENIFKIAETALKFSPEAAFIGLTPVDEERTNPIFWETDAVYKNEYIKQYNDYIKEFCGDNDLPFIDIFNEMKNLDLKNLLEDGIHPNGKGYQVMEEIIRKAIFEEN